MVPAEVVHARTVVPLPAPGGASTSPIRTCPSGATQRAGTQVSWAGAKRSPDLPVCGACSVSTVRTRRPLAAWARAACESALSTQRPTARAATGTTVTSSAIRISRAAVAVRSVPPHTGPRNAGPSHLRLGPPARKVIARLPRSFIGVHLRQALLTTIIGRGRAVATGQCSLRRRANVPEFACDAASPPALTGHVSPSAYCLPWFSQPSSRGSAAT